MGNRVIEFDIIRVLAIFLILFHHLTQHSFDFHVFYLKGHLLDLSFLYWWESYFALGVFVFISGYLLTMENPSFKGWRDVKHFILKRYIRIFPLYIVALALFIALNGEIRDSLNICSFVLNLLGLQVIFGSKYSPPLLTLWFVGLILSYYYSFIFLIKLGGGVIRFVALAFAISLLSALLMQRVGLMDQRFLLYFGIFAAGILGAKFKLIEKMKFSHILFILLLFIILIWFDAALIRPEEIPRSLSLIGVTSFVLHNLIVLCLVCIALALARAVIQADRYGFFRKIAYASYGMYLFHRPVWWIMEDIYNPASVKFKAVYLALFGIPLTIFGSYYSQKFYDKYFKMRLIKGLT